MSFTSFFHLIFHSCSIGDFYPSPRNKIHNFNQCNMTFLDEEITLDVAVSKTERELGLSYREKLPNNEGMLFYLDKENQISFQTQKIKFDICIIFLDANKNILHFQVLPPKGNILSAPNSNYALELSANHCSKMQKIKTLPLCDRE